MQKKWKKMFHALHKVDMRACYAKEKINLAYPKLLRPLLKSSINLFCRTPSINPFTNAIPHMLNPTIFQVPYKRPYEILATLLKKNQRSLGAILLSCYLNIINQFTTLLQITDKTMSLLTQLQRRSQSQQLYVRITVSDQKIKNL